MSKRETIIPAGAAKSIGPYSPAARAGSLVYTSGQIGVDAATGQMGETIQDQAHQAMKNLKTVLEAAGASFDTVLKATCFLSDMDNFAAFNEVYAQYFPGDYPARTCVAVKTLPRNALVEIEMIACTQ